MKRNIGFAGRLRLRRDRNKKHYACKEAKARIKFKQLRRIHNIISLHGNSDAANAGKKRSRQKKKPYAKCTRLYDRGGRTRTLGPRLWRPLLYQLSYAPTDLNRIAESFSEIKKKTMLSARAIGREVSIFAAGGICRYKSGRKSPAGRMGSRTSGGQGASAKVAAGVTALIRKGLC